jgi:hypothetical protein
MPENQRGQATLLGLVIIVLGLVSLLLLFNSGQLVREKTSLNNASDAAAYAAATVHARALNFGAYTNRALVANEIAVGQAISLQSWLGALNTYQEHAPGIVPIFCNWAAMWIQNAQVCMIPMVGLNSHQNSAFTGFAAPTALATVPTWDSMITASEAAQTVLASSQEVVFNQLRTSNIPRDVMLQVARANVVEPINNISIELVDEAAAAEQKALWLYQGRPVFYRYSDNERLHLTEALTRPVKNQDPFLGPRTWEASNLYADWGCWALAVSGQVSRRIRRGGGTELNGIDEWRAEDTISYYERRARIRRLSCRSSTVEIPVNGGGAMTGDSSSVPWNGNFSATATYVSGQQYQNSHTLPSFYDLTPALLTSDQPVTPRLFVKVTKPENTLRTTAGGTAVPQSVGRLEQFQASGQGNEMASASAAEAYFDDPNQAVGTTTIYDTMLSPYWVARLSSMTTRERAVLTGSQGGVVFP